jgi:hypothetical protein
MAETARHTAKTRENLMSQIPKRPSAFMLWGPDPCKQILNRRRFADGLMPLGNSAAGRFAARLRGPFGGA